MQKESRQRVPCRVWNRHLGISDDDVQCLPFFFVLSKSGVSSTPYFLNVLLFCFFDTESKRFWLHLVGVKIVCRVPKKQKGNRWKFSSLLPKCLVGTALWWLSFPTNHVGKEVGEIRKRSWEKKWKSCEKKQRVKLLDSSSTLSELGHCYTLSWLIWHWPLKLIDW